MDKETISLSEHKLKVSELEKQVSEFKLAESVAKNTIDGLKSDVQKLSEEVKTLKAEKEKTEKEAKFQLLFSEGKINAAQLTALKEGKDMLDVLSLSEKLNTKAQGSSESNNDVVQLTAEELEICKKLELSAEDYVKYNK